MVGALVSALVERLRNQHGFTGGQLTILAVVLSIVAGSAYVLLVHVGWWDTVLKVLAAACSFYAIVIKNMRPDNA